MRAHISRVSAHSAYAYPVCRYVEAVFDSLPAEGGAPAAKRARLAAAVVRGGGGGEGRAAGVCVCVYVCVCVCVCVYVCS